MKTTLILLPMLLVACASNSSRKASPVVKSPQVVEMEKKKRAREEARQDQKDRDRVLAQKRSSSPISIKARPQNKKIDVVAITGSQVNISEKNLYSELVSTYDSNNWIGFESRFQLFREKYPQSVLADEVLYLGGLFQLTNKNYGQALTRFNEVLTKYPRSNKTVSAQFAKGIALKRMNLLKESEAALKKAMSQYPGSPEAARAEAELKILQR